MKCRKFFLFFCLLILFPVTCHAYTTSNIEWNSSWQYANESAIHSGHSVLYKIDDDDSRHTVAINAGHGTQGGESVQTYCNPAHSQKIVDGSSKSGVTKVDAIKTGMTFKGGKAEATATYDMAKITRDLLLENGFNVLMIRDGDDVQLDNIARTVIANNNAEIHLSIHWDDDKYSYDKGVFFMSVPDNTDYRNMEPVKSYWQKHDELGRKIISVMKQDGIKIFGNGEVKMDLTQTSFSTIPSVDIEFGNQYSKTDDESLKTLANAFVHGIAEYFDTSFTPSKNGGSKVSTDGAINLDNYNIRAEDKPILEEAMKSWPSELESGRIEIIKNALSLINIGIHYPSTKHPAPDGCIKGHFEIDHPKSGDGMDCSDYAAWVFYASGATDVDIHSCAGDFATSSAFVKINESDLLPADVATYNANPCGDYSSGSGNHVGIYFGEANGQRIYLHSTAGSTVTGPQVRKGTGQFTMFRRYKDFSSISSNSSSEDGTTNPGLDHDPYPDNGFQNIEAKDVTCKSVFMKSDGSNQLNELGEAMQGLFNFIKIATPILVLILTTIDYIKAIAHQDDSNIKKTTQKTMKRLIFGVLIFLLPFLLDLLFHAFGLYDLSTCNIGYGEENTEIGFDGDDIYEEDE